MRRRQSLIQAYQTLEWSEITMLGALTIALGAIIESSFLSGGWLPSMTVGMPFVAAALAFRHYEWESIANRTSAAFVAAAMAMGIQVLVALIVT